MSAYFRKRKVKEQKGKEGKRREKKGEERKRKGKGKKISHALGLKMLRRAVLGQTKTTYNRIDLPGARVQPLRHRRSPTRTQAQARPTEHRHTCG
jgi:hypothetical protein